ncbi:GlxA family transcriptional regulator [Kocuria palustris]|uniref:GlxA family transcriptional regulator n=1 Tax=Kocuria palustris TaxID=71999 RepID=UPI002469438D|nr:AraC family transcriptional regulator [Kocuria palustris]MDH5150758.1 AraC family transcriptional regulator [Kocuria palustris]
MTADGAAPMRRVDIVVFDGMTLLDAAGPLEVLRVTDPSGELYCTRLVSTAGGRVRSSAGLEVLTESPSLEGAADTVIVAGGDRLVAEPIDDELLQLAGDLAQSARRVASVCTGAFVLARLGLLDGRRVTTHWRHAQALADRFPLLDVQPDVIHVRDGRIATSAGISAGLDLTLALVEEDLGAAAAREAARELGVFMQRPGGQAQFSSALRQATVGDAGLQTVMGEVIEHPERTHSVASMAERLGGERSAAAQAGEGADRLVAHAVARGRAGRRRPRDHPQRHAADVSGQTSWIWVGRDDAPRLPTAARGDAERLPRALHQHGPLGMG